MLCALSHTSTLLDTEKTTHRDSLVRQQKPRRARSKKLRSIAIVCNSCLRIIVTSNKCCALLRAVHCCVSSIGVSALNARSIDLKRRLNGDTIQTHHDYGNDLAVLCLCVLVLYGMRVWVSHAYICDDDDDDDIVIDTLSFWGYEPCCFFVY